MLTTAEAIITHVNNQCVVTDSPLFKLSKDAPYTVVYSLHCRIITGKQIPHSEILPVLRAERLAVLNVNGMFQTPGTSRILTYIGKCAVVIIIFDIFFFVLIHMGAVRCRIGQIQVKRLSHMFIAAFINK